MNGIDGASGQYVLPAMSPAIIAKVATGERLDDREREELRARYAASTGAFLGLVDGVDATDLGQTGWGIVLAPGTEPAVKEALAPLLAHRKAQAGAQREDRYREYEGVSAPQPTESSAEFLVRYGIAPGQPANPDKMPYYLLLAGDPEALPFRFQYQLGVTYAAGRIHFDRPEEYAAYAERIVATERAEAAVRPAAFFAPRNDDDTATPQSADHLVAPLAERLAAAFPDRTVRTMMADQATKAGLAGLLSGDERPGLLFTASHGMSFPSGDPRQLAQQGALLCQDWPGPVHWQEGIPPEFYFAGEDVAGGLDPTGMVVFLFACFGGGTPRADEFAQHALGAPIQIAPRSFVGRLPARLLSGGALAVVGHVDRTWGYSFVWPGAGEQLDVFFSALSQVLRGVPVGSAMEFFSNRYAALTVTLESEKERISFGTVPDDTAVAALWVARNDARNYVILGDPAARLGYGSPQASGSPSVSNVTSAMDVPSTTRGTSSIRGP